MYKVKIDSFEGPFDLLVYLIENARMNIYDIQISEITNQYMEYLKNMESLDIDVGSEFIVLAAVLLKIKSQMLLPRGNSTNEIEIEEDPRKNLAERLSEYIKIKKISEMLKKREKYGFSVYEKPAEDISIYTENADEVLKADPEKFVDAFFSFLEKKKRINDVRRRYQTIRRQRDSIEERIEDISNFLEYKLLPNDEVNFSEILPENADRYDITLSFMSILEMVKMQKVSAKQEKIYGEIKLSHHNED